MIATIDTPLAEFLELFKVERLRGKNQRYIDTYGRAIEWLAVTLGRDPCLSDLTADNVRATMRTVFDAGNQFYWTEKMRTRLCSLWKHANRTGVVTNYQRVPVIDFDGSHAYLERPPSGNTVSGYYLDKYRPGLTGAVRDDTDAAVRSLDKQLDRYATLEEITDDLLLDFGRWLTGLHKSPGRVARYQATIRQVVRSWDPASFPLHAPRALPPMPPPPPGSLREFFESRYIPERMLDCSEGGIDNHRMTLRRLYDHYGRDVMLDELDDTLLADHLRWLKSDRDLANVSVNGHRGAIRAVWHFAEEVGIVSTRSRIKKLQEEWHEPDSWAAEDVRAMLDATSVFADRHWQGCVPLDLFWRGLFLVEWYTALRIGALLSIRMDDVDLQTGWIYVRPGKQKNRRGKKYRVGLDAVGAIAEIWEPQRKLLFDWPYRRESIWRHFRTIQAAANVPDSALSNNRFHKMRRTAATLAAVNSGLAAAIALLDHSGPEVTKRYLDPTKLPGCDATAYLPRLLDQESEVIT